MTQRRLDLTQRQIHALCAGVKKAGYIPVIEIGNTVVKLVPEDRAILRAEQHVDRAEEDIGL